MTGFSLWGLPKFYVAILAMPSLWSVLWSGSRLNICCNDIYPECGNSEFLTIENLFAIMTWLFLQLLMILDSIIIARLACVIQFLILRLVSDLIETHDPRAEGTLVRLYAQFDIFTMWCQVRSCDAWLWMNRAHWGLSDVWWFIEFGTRCTLCN